MPKPGTKQESPISASARAKATLARIAEEIGVRKIDLLDQAINALADHYAHHGNRLLLPLRFHETFSVVQLPMPRRNITLTETLQPGDDPNVESGARPSRSKKHARTPQ